MRYRRLTPGVRRHLPTRPATGAQSAAPAAGAPPRHSRRPASWVALDGRRRGGGRRLCRARRARGPPARRRRPPTAATVQPADRCRPGPRRLEGAIDVAAVAAMVAPSVVTISADIDSDEFGAAGSIGTGVITTTDGEVLTNAHVVEGATAIRVRLAGETEPRCGHVARRRPGQRPGTAAPRGRRLRPGDVCRPRLGPDRRRRGGDRLRARPRRRPVGHARHRLRARPHARPRRRGRSTV